MIQDILLLGLVEIKNEYNEHLITQLYNIRNRIVEEALKI